jgi:16S rRNA (uracil1498-N3)-methyltransferase
MSMPFFFHPNIPAEGIVLTLEEDASKHIISVLRMQVGERILITDGTGRQATTVISGDHRKRCSVTVESVESVPVRKPRLTMAVSPLKNASRYEWFLEKATELGVNAIVPLICQRTEKTHLRRDRLQGILVSAMLQSRQAWLPEFPEPVPFPEYLKLSAQESGVKFIAHCEPGEKKELSSAIPDPHADRIILIGPEGDFTPQEIEAALAAGWVPASLGPTRLRTETAAIFAASLLRS